MEETTFKLLDNAMNNEGIIEIKDADVFNELKKFCRRDYITEYSSYSGRMFGLGYALRNKGWLEEKDMQPFDDGLLHLLCDVKFEFVEPVDYGNGVEDCVTDFIATWRPLTEYDINNVSEYLVESPIKSFKFRYDVINTAKENGIMTCEAILLVLESYIINNIDPSNPI